MSAFLNVCSKPRNLKTQPALVGPNRIVELYAPGAIHLGTAFVIHPGDAEDDGPVRLCHPFEDLGAPILGVLDDEGHQGLDHFMYRLVELRLSRVPRDEPTHEAIDLCCRINSGHWHLLCRLSVVGWFGAVWVQSGTVCVQSDLLAQSVDCRAIGARDRYWPGPKTARPEAT